MSTPNGTATIETVASAVAVAETTTAVDVMQIPPMTETAPVEKISALDQVDRWFADVVKMRDALTEEEGELTARLNRVRSTRERLSQVVAIFEGPAVATVAPAPIAMETIVQPEAVAAPAMTPVAKRWATDHDACINCGGTDEKHAAFGRCTRCDRNWRRFGTERPIESKEQKTS